jgi:ubiquinone/menaquinone biosynthesis C-methylase UbiE
MMEVKKTTLFDIDKIISKVEVGDKHRIAELGCGNFGFFTFPLARLVGKNGTVYAVDVMKNYLNEIELRAKESNLPQITTVWSNLEIFKGTKIEAASLDSAFLVNVLHQSDKRAEIIREALRLLKTNGKLVIVEWNSSESPLGPESSRRLKLEALKTAALKLGFDIKEEFEAGPYHYGLVLVKL